MECKSVVPTILPHLKPRDLFDSLPGNRRVACYARGVSFIQVKNVPEHLHEAVRRRAAGEGMTVSDYVLDLIERDLAVPSRREWFDRLTTRRSADVPVPAALDDARAERADELIGG